MAQTQAHRNTCRKTGSLGFWSLFLIFNRQLRMYSSTAWYRHWYITHASHSRDKSVLLTKLPFSPFSPSPGSSLHCSIKALTGWHTVEWKPPAQQPPPSHLPAFFHITTTKMWHGNFHPPWAIYKKGIQNIPTNSPQYFPYFFTVIIVEKGTIPPGQVIAPGP